MHMADALLSPNVGLSLWAGTIVTISYCARKLKSEINEKIIPLMGIMGAFIFTGQMINFTIPLTGSSGHIGGGMLLAIVLGPWAAFITIASVLFIQALFFADGGLLALGCNIWNLGIYPCFIAYPFIYKTISGGNPGNKKIMAGSILSVIIGVELGAFSVVMETIISGITELKFIPFISLMLPIHLAIGLIEGVITGTIIIYIKNVQGEIFDYTSGHNSEKEQIKHLSFKNILISIGILTIITGGIFSWFASSHPDGLEWTIKKMTGKNELSTGTTDLHKLFSGFQKKTAILPDYNFKKDETSPVETGKESRAVVSTGTSAAGIIGGIFTLVIAVLAGLAIKLFKKRNI